MASRSGRAASRTRARRGGPADLFYTGLRRGARDRADLGARAVRDRRALRPVPAGRRRARDGLRELRIPLHGQAACAASRTCGHRRECEPRDLRRPHPAQQRAGYGAARSRPRGERHRAAHRDRPGRTSRKPAGRHSHRARRHGPRGPARRPVHRPGSTTAPRDSPRAARAGHVRASSDRRDRAPLVAGLRRAALRASRAVGVGPDRCAAPRAHRLAGRPDLGPDLGPCPGHLLYCIFKLPFAAYQWAFRQPLRQNPLVQTIVAARALVAA